MCEPFLCRPGVEVQTSHPMSSPQVYTPKDELTKVMEDQTLPFVFLQSLKETKGERDKRELEDQIAEGERDKEALYNQIAQLEQENGRLKACMTRTLKHLDEDIIDNEGEEMLECVGICGDELFVRLCLMNRARGELKEGMAKED